MISAKDKFVLLKLVVQLQYIGYITHLRGYIASTQPSPPFAKNVRVPLADSFTWYGVAPRFFDCWNQIAIRLSSYAVGRLPLTPDPLILLLGIYDKLPIQKHTKWLLFYASYYARREILLKWKLFWQSFYNDWWLSVRYALPIYHYTYMSRGCPTCQHG